MSLNITSARSSGIRKARSKTGLASSPSSGRLSQPRRKPASQRTSKDADEDEIFTGRLSDTGILVPLVPRGSISDVVAAIHYVQRNMFSEIPERASGLNSTRTSTILNFRASLPSLVSVAHVHAILNTPTTTERELARLIKDGTVRRISVPGRRDGVSGGGEMLVLMEDWERMVSKCSTLSDDIKSKSCLIDPLERCLMTRTGLSRSLCQAPTN